MPSVAGATNYVVVVDDYTGLIVCGIIGAKSEAPQFVIDTIKAMQNKYGKKVAQLRSDKNSVFTSGAHKDWLRQSGTQFEPSSGYSPEENGHAEREPSARRARRMRQCCRTAVVKEYVGGVPQARCIHHKYLVLGWIQQSVGVVEV